MEAVSKYLKCVFFALIAFGLAAVLFETGVITPGDCGGGGKVEFYVLTAMELLTVALIPLALYLFRIPYVHRQLIATSEPSLRKWGLFRMLMIGLPMVANTLYYYLFMSASFGYLAIICLISMVFIYPSLERCKQETSEEEPKEESQEELKEE